MKNIKSQTWFSAGCLLGVALMLLIGGSAPPKYATTSQLVWTNTGTTIAASPAISMVGKTTTIGDGVANPPGGLVGAYYIYSSTTNIDDVEFHKHRISGSSVVTGVDEHDVLNGPGVFSGLSLVHGYWYCEITNRGGLSGGLDFNDRNGVYNMVSEVAPLSGLEGSQTDFSGETMGLYVYSHSGGKRNTSIGIHHADQPNLSGTATNIGLAVVMEKNGSGPYTGLYVETYLSGTDPSSPNPNYQPAVAIFDSRRSGLSIFQCRSNNGSLIVHEVTDTKTTNTTVMSSAGGFGSFSTISTNQIPTTGWTNNAEINVTVLTTATAVSFTINNRAGTVIYTSPTLTATVPVNLQPGWSVRAASGLTGTVVPF